ncbi:glycosyltransferase family 4 protein [Micromonospora sp. HM5-17]|jgi:glycosyltransferase involved in cell wall biosynthesis|uniref:glycosyltransferase family 4 protein n=1 Tax=Micromonospora sp. HM5-17 TaxID=2487710 RepID=UPI000F484E93|nr:glycosyltransferase family 4 protein [Micromonospora sp. HM5-17]ROT29753.1 glycosyltransferase WbuB [Micromonospora sp. HM5-17]
MRIGVISYWFPPEPAFIPGCLAEELAARGHEVRVLTGFPNHPTGRIYPGYRQRWRAQSVEGGVTIRRVPSYVSHDGTAARRMARQLTYAMSSALAAPGYLSGVDAVYVYFPPAGAYAAAALLRLLRRVPAVLHLQDVWPEGVTAPSPDGRGERAGMVHGLLSRTMRAIYRSASGIAVIAPSMRDVVIERGADPEKVRVVLNWTDERLFRPLGPTPAARRAIGHRGRTTIMHAGTMGPFQRVDTAVRAAAALDGKHDVDLVLVGSGPEEAQSRRLAEELGATNVRFLGWRPPAEMAELYAAAEYQLVLLRDLPALRGSVPAKLQAALSAGAPVVASAGGDTADLVERARVGLSCPPEDWQALADRFALATMIPSAAREEMARRARDSYLARMSLRAGVDQMEQMLAEAAASRRPR